MMILDRPTYDHLMNWLMDYSHDADRVIEAKAKIEAFLNEYPEMLETHSWKEILDLAERD